MSAAGFTPIQLYRSTTASAVPTSGNLADGELAINTNDGKLYYKDSGGTVQLIASKAGASGDVVGPASATDNAVVRFDGTTGKLVQNSVVTIADSTGDIAGVGQLNATTVDTTDIEVTNIKAKDGTAAASIANSTGVITVSTQLNVDNLNLSVNTISSTDTNGNIVLAPNGTGDVQLDADTVRVGDSGAAATITTNGAGNLTLSTNAGTNSGTIVINQGANGDIALTPNGTGRVTTSALSATTPRVITSINDTNGNELFGVTATASAVNEFTVANAATGSGPTLSATGSDTNIDFNITPKGTGKTNLATNLNVTGSSADVGNTTPEMYGAVGNGVADDTTAVQNAVNTGKTVVLTAGKTYKITSAISVTTNYQKIIGQGVLAPSGAINGVSVTGCTGVELALNFNSSAHSANYCVNINNANRVKITRLNIVDGFGAVYITKANTVAIDWAWGTCRGPGIVWYGDTSNRSDILVLQNVVLSVNSAYYALDWDGNCHSLEVKYFGHVGGKGIIVRNTSGSAFPNTPAIGRFTHIESDYSTACGIEIVVGLDIDITTPYINGAASDGIKIAAGISDYQVRISGGKIIGNTGYGINNLGGVVLYGGTTDLSSNTSGESNGSLWTLGKRFALDSGSYFTLSSGNPLLAFDTNDYISYDRTNNKVNTYVGGTAITSVGANLEVSSSLLVNSSATVYNERLRVEGTGGTAVPTNLSSLSGALTLISSSRGTTAYGGVGYADGGGGGAAVVFKRGAGYDTEILFCTNPAATAISGAMTERMRLDSSGNLGLGVQPSAWAAGYKALDVGTLSTFVAGGGGQPIIGYNYYNNGTDRYKANAAASAYEQGAGQHRWYTAPSGTAGNAISFTQAMTLDASGNLGVGGTSPYARVAAYVASSGTFQNALGATNSVDSDLTVRIKTGVSDIANSAGVLTFTTGGSERARITSGGDLLLGITTFNTTPGGFAFAPTSAAFFSTGHATGTATGTEYANYAYNGVVIGSITQNGTTGVLYNITSDYRLKTVTGPITSAGPRIDALEPIEYTWKSDGSVARGFLAHQFQEVYPNSVTGEKDAVDADGKPVYQNMQASTSEVIADLVAEIKSLRQRVSQLEGA